MVYVDISPNAQSQEIDTYNLAANVTTLNNTSRVYYLEESDDLRYRLVFGDGILGRKLINGEFIRLSYVTTFGEEANGCKDFAFIGTIRDSDQRAIAPANIAVVTRESAADGEARESALSIKFRAPRSFATQNRAVTETDYEHIVSEIYPQAASVTAYGGEKLTPPIYGKVYVAIRPKTGNKLNETTKAKIKNDLKRYTVASIDPVIIDPTIFYVIPKSYVYYDGNNTNKSGAQLGSDVLRNVDQFNKNGQTNRFGGRIDTSKYNAMVDNSDPAISGSVTQMTVGQNLDQFEFGNVFTQCLDFGNPLYDPGNYAGKPDSDGADCSTDTDCPEGQVCRNGKCVDEGDSGTCAPSFSVVKSGTFYATGYSEDLVNLTLQGSGTNSTSAVVSSNSITGENEVLVPVNIRDDGKGNLLLITKRDEVEVVLNNAVGTVDYSKGQVCVGPLAIQGTPDDSTRLPIQVLPYGGSILIPPGVDPTLFDVNVFPIDWKTNDISIPNFDPNNFSGYNFGDPNGINIIDYPTDSFTYPVDTSCF